MTYTLEALDKLELFSITAWKSAEGWTVGVQRFAGDPVKYVKHKELSQAIACFLTKPVMPPPPYQVGV
jgi:hypothetical protein